VASHIWHNPQGSRCATGGAGSSDSGCLLCIRIRIRRTLLAERPELLARSPEKCAAIARTTNEIRAPIQQQVHLDGFNDPVGLSGREVGRRPITDISIPHAATGETIPGQPSGIWWLIHERAGYWADEDVEASP